MTKELDYIMKGKIYGFAFVGNPLVVRHKLPFVIAEGVVLKKPTKTQLNKVKEYLNDFTGYTITDSPFENDFFVSKKGQTKNLKFETFDVKMDSLDEDDWRF